MPNQTRPSPPHVTSAVAENKRPAAGKYGVGKADPVGIKRQIDGLRDEARRDKSCTDLPLEPGGLRVELLDPLDHRQKPQR